MFTNLDTYRRVVCDVALVLKSEHYESDTEKAFSITHTVINAYKNSIATDATLYWLIEVVKRNPEVLEFYHEGQKINAIKEVRARIAAPCPDKSCPCGTGTHPRKHYVRIGLKEAKEGVEHFERTRHA